MKKDENSAYEAVFGWGADEKLHKFGHPWKRKYYPKAAWAVRQAYRAGGVVEDICPCGVGHANRVWLQENPDRITMHTCCPAQCCSK